MLNAAGIVAGGIFGHLFGRFFTQRHQEALTGACGVSVLFIGVAGAMEGMLRVEDGALGGGGSMFVVLCLALGTLVGELIDIEGWFGRLGEWLKVKTGSAKDRNS